MALAVNDLVYQDAGAEDNLRQDSPLFGEVVSVTGTTPDVVKVVYENGQTQTFPTTTPPGIVEIAVDPSADQFIGRWVNTEAGGAQIMRSFLDVDAGNARTFLVRSQQGYYFIGRFALTYPTKATNLNGDEGEPV